MKDLGKNSVFPNRETNIFYGGQKKKKKRGTWTPWTPCA